MEGEGEGPCLGLIRGPRVASWEPGGQGQDSGIAGEGGIRGVGSQRRLLCVVM